MTINDFKISLSDINRPSTRMLEDDSVYFKSVPVKETSIFRISYERWPKGYFINRDNRENAIVVLIVKGTLEYDYGSGKIEIGKGELFCSSPNYPLFIKAISQEVQLRRITLQGKDLNKFLINNLGTDKGKIKIQNSLEILNIFQSMLAEAKSRNLEFGKCLYSYLELLFVLIKRNLQIPKKSNQGNNKLFNQSKVLFDTLELNKVSVALAADQLLVSPEHLSRVFKSQFKITPLEYILTRKMGQAANLLSSSDNSLFEIAEWTGYANEYVFSRAFKKFYGVPPGQWRKKYDSF